MLQAATAQRKKLYYVPLEPYRARYTEYVSGEYGTYMTMFRKFMIPTDRVYPAKGMLPDNNAQITHGSVVDALSRTRLGFWQIEELCKLVLQGVITGPEDYIYFEDFWTPGMDALMYALNTKLGPNKENWPGIGGFWHAQTTDPYDFTASWLPTMRPFEAAMLNMYTDIFVATVEMTELITAQGLPISRIHDVGLPFVADVVRKMYHNSNVPTPKENIVVFASRFDTEKSPETFMRLADMYLSANPETDVQFVICSGSEAPSGHLIKSNSLVLQQQLADLVARYPDHVKVITNATKERYYSLLRHAKVSFNNAYQDLISYTLLEASLFDCHPLYPDWFTFPATLGWDQQFLHDRSMESIVSKLKVLLQKPPSNYSWIHQKCADMPQRVLYAAGFHVDDPGSYQDACNKGRR